MRDQYPKKVRPNEVANDDFAPGLFRIKGGRAFYDQVHLNDGGRAFYLVRITVESNGLKVVKRWIKSDTALEQMFEV
jgi:hypothetical protein